MIAFLRLVPSWVWVAILLVGAGLWYGQTRYNAGQADVKAECDKSIDRGKVLLADKEREYRAQEHRHAADMARIGMEHQEELTNAQREGERTAADLLAGTIRLQKQWRGCPATGLPGVVAGSSGASEEAGLQAASVGRIDRTVAECEAHVVSLQQVTQRDRAKP